MWLDIIAVVLIVAAGLIGMKRGLMLTILDVCSLAIAIIVSVMFSTPVSKLILSMGIEDKFQALAIAFLVIFVITWIALFVIKMLVRIIQKLPIIKQLNGVGGLLVGLAGGVLIVCVFAVFLHSFGTQETVASLVEAVEKSVIMKFFYEKNFIDLVMKMI